MTQKPSPFNITIILLSAILLLSACGSSSGSVSYTLPPYKGPMPTVVLDNTAPANIDIDLLMKIMQPSPTNPTVFSIGVAFYYQRNTIIIFKHGEKFACNGVALPMDSTSGYITPKIPAPGTVMNCTYTSPQGQASFSVTVPEQPKIISPINGSTVARSAQTPMVVSVIPTCKVLGVEVGFKNSHGYGGQGVDGDGCVAQQTVNALNVPVAGPGYLGVNEGVAESDATTNPGFHAFVVSMYSEATVAITWQ